MLHFYSHKRGQTAAGDEQQDFNEPAGLELRCSMTKLSMRVEPMSRVTYQKHLLILKGNDRLPKYRSAVHLCQFLPERLTLFRTVTRYNH